MAKGRENIPSPDVLMNSMRSIGYSFKTAIADIIDNSISANARNIWIAFPTKTVFDRMYVTIIDDGKGMNGEELFNAMKYGSVKDNCTSTDLGRFGLGLKSASLSQCKKLTVVSKKNQSLFAYRWDLDNVKKAKKWECLELDEIEINQLPNVDKLSVLESGVLVIWEEFDIGFKKSNGHLVQYISQEIDETEKHIRLVFHRFLNRKNNKVNIFINKYQIIGYDPFLENHKKVDIKPINNLGDGITMQACILPHQSDLTNEDIETLGGMESLKDNQGFYVYRNDRLIIFGTWFKMSSRDLDLELFKYGRIKVDIPNTLDDMWEIDIKKQNAIVPRRIINLLKKTVTTVCLNSRQKTTKRVRLDYEVNDNKIWNKLLNRDNKEYYFINYNSNFISNFLNDFEDKDRTKIIKLLEVISNCIPYDDIYNTVCNRLESKVLEEDKIDTIVLFGYEQFKQIKNIKQCSDEVAFEKLCQSEPFNSTKILERLWKYINAKN